MEPIIRLTGIAQGYRRRKVISDLDLEVGIEVLGLLGPNGAGKTTLLRTMATVAPPQAGTVEICGSQVESQRSALAARRNIGYLSQDFGYFPGYSVYDFVCYCAWLRDVPRRNIGAATVQAIEASGLADWSGAKMKSLSGGMLQRAGIASAIVGSPRLLILDEPSVGLDPVQRLEFRALLRSLTDTAVVLSTHLVEDIAAISDDIAVMRDGRFVFRGTPQELAESAAQDAPGDSALERGYVTALNGRKVAAS